MTTTKIATIGIALMLCAGGAYTSSRTPGQPQRVAQMIPAQTAEPAPTPTSAHTDQNGVNATPAPTATGIDQAPAVDVNGQPSPLPAATPEPAAPVSAPVTAPNAVPATDTTAPAMPSNATIDLKHGGLAGNSNGDNWIDKFNRNPGPETGNVPATTKIKTKVKAKKYPPNAM